MSDYKKIDEIYYLNINKEFEYEVVDSNLKNKSIKKENIKVDNILENGEYLLDAEDKAGNVSNIKIIRYKSKTFKNKDKLEENFKISTFYEVELPGYIFKEKSGKYSFKDEKTAKAFAKKIERDTRVRKINGKLIYVSLSNERIDKEYDSESELERVLEIISSKYYKGKKYITRNKRSYGKILNSDFDEDTNSFIKTNLKKPEFITLDLQLYQANINYIFKDYRNFGNIGYKKKLIFLANDTGLKTNREIIIKNKKSIYESLREIDFLKNGYYKVVEEDYCKNIEEYLVYIDFKKPYLMANITTGIKNEVIKFDSDYTLLHNGLMKYISFDIKKLFDEVDKDEIVLKINGAGIDNKYYSLGDEIPVLDFKYGYRGRYQIKIFDRSENILEFEIVIAGNPPFMSYTSLRKTTKSVIFTFNINDKDNTFKEIEIFKIDESGNRTKIEKDDEEKIINSGNIEYIFKNGGKFISRMLDIYDREIFSSEIFYEKGLPTGELSIKNGEITNKIVTFEYSNNYEAIVYEIRENREEISLKYLKDINQLEAKTKLVFDNEKGKEVNYKIFLYNKNQRDLFIEYYFGQDTNLEKIFIEELETKRELTREDSTNKGFKLKYTDYDLRIYYSYGVGFETKYKKDEILTADGLYKIKVSDPYGNKEEFKILIDKSVSYKIDGYYLKRENNNFLTNKNIKIEVKEALKSYKCKKDKNLNIEQGEILRSSGIYEIEMIDLFDNRQILIIEIDKENPILNLSGLNKESKTKDKVTISFNEGKAKLFLKSEFLKDIENNEVINKEGIYRIVVEDDIGNKTVRNFEIDKTVNAFASIPNNTLTNKRVRLILNEKSEIYLNNILTDKKEFEEEGKYEIKIVDELKNEKIIRFEIIKTKGREITINKKVLKVLKDGKEIKPTNKFSQTGKYRVSIENGEDKYILDFEIDSTKPEIKITKKWDRIKFSRPNKKIEKYTLMKNGKQISYPKNNQIKESGNYKLILEDEIGNINEYNFTFKKRINVFGIIAILFATLVLFVIIIYAIKKRKLKI